MNLDTIGLRHGQIVPYDERVIKNAWTTDVFGRTLSFSDLGVIEVAKISKASDPYGAILALAEDKADSLDLTNAESPKNESTETQRLLLKGLAKLEGLKLPRSLAKRAEQELPVLFLSEFAVAANAIYFREGKRKMVFETILQKITQSSKLKEVKDNHLSGKNNEIIIQKYLAREINLIDLDTPVYAITVARHAVAAGLAEA